MKCRNCGTEIQGQTKFCTKCGSKVEQLVVEKAPVSGSFSHAISEIWPEWQIEKQLGKGSYGVVYQAIRRDNNVESHAAIKIISIPSDSSEVDSLRSEGLDMDGTRTYFKGIVDDFVSEIQLMESLKGVQNIVSVEDYKVVEKTDAIGWDIYIRMELLTPFNTYICDKTLTEEKIIKLGTDICTALEICSQRNIIHRDIKPENIFVNDFGYFKLGDFGIARKLENMTGGLSQKGTFNYMAPEVANSNEYDARVDIYSLGIVLYRLLNNNKLPFLDTDKQLLSPNERKLAVERRIKGESLPAPCNASPSMANLILRACAHNPNARFNSATEMKQALMSVANGTYTIVDAGLDRTTSVRSAQTNYDDTTSVRKATGTGENNSQPVVNAFGEAPKKKRKKGKIITISVLVALLLLVITLTISFFSSDAYGVYRDMQKGEIDDALSDYQNNVEDNFIQEILLDMLLNGRVDELMEEFNAGTVEFDDAEAEMSALKEMKFDGAKEKYTELLSQHADKTVEKFNNNEINYEEAVSEIDFLEAKGFEDAVNTRNEIMSKHANDTVDNYNSGKLAYDDAVSILTSIQSDGYVEADSLIDQITKSENADNALKQADTYYANGDFESAIEEYEKIPEGNENYEKAQEQLNKVYADYIKSTVETAKKHNSSKNYKQAIQVVNTAYDILPDIVDTTELDTVKEESLASYKTEVANEVAEMTENEKWSAAFDVIDEAIAFDDNEYFQNLKASTEDDYVNYVYTVAQKHMDELNYTKAAKFVQTALQLLPNNSRLIALEEQVDTNTPTPLNELHLIDSSRYYSYNKDIFTDSFGNVYDGHHFFDECSEGAYAIYNLNEKFDTFNCSVVGTQYTNSTTVFAVYIYLDGKLSYTLSDFTKASEKADISIDVSDVTKLEIRTGASAYSYSRLAIVNAFVFE